MNSSKIARQLTRSSRTLIRVVQAAAACCSVVIALALAIVSGREPSKPNPIFAQQTLVERSMQREGVAGQPMVISANEQHSDASREEGQQTSVLRPALEPDADSRKKSTWAANTVLAAGGGR